MSLETNYTKTQLAEKVRELTEKLKEMRQVEAQVSASVETLKDGNPAIGLVQNENGMFQLVRIVFDLEKNAAAIIATEDYGKDFQIAGGRLVKEAGDVFLKASGSKYYK
jgi:hypothetical protein